MSDRPFFSQADAIGVQPLEMFSLEAQRQRLVISTNLDLKDELKNVLNDIGSWLPVAAEAYNISPKITDYIMSPVISMPTDLPNRNQQAFPFTELTRWTVDAGTIMYRTWSGKPIFQDHRNKDPSIANGIILSTLMRPIANTAGRIWKLIKLAAVDRERDSVLANQILTGERNSWSMGAYARDYNCTICGSLLSRTPNHLGCEHVKYGKPEFRTYAGRLAYHTVVDAVGFELSNVTSPAFYSAKDMPHFSF